MPTTQIKIKKEIDYKKELESASKGMILIHEPKVLIRLIVRMIVSKVNVRHAAMILYDDQKDSYVLAISRGESGIKIPAGFARIEKNSPLIRVFYEKDYKHFISDNGALMTSDLDKLLWKESIIENGHGARELLNKVSEQMQILNTIACVPAYYQGMLLAVLLLGEKNSGKRFVQEELDFFSALASDVAMAIRNAELFDNLKREAMKNRSLFIRTTIALASAIEAKDQYTAGHTERVTKYALAIARQMVLNGSAQFHPVFFEDLHIAGLLHDIGKIGVPESILCKTGKLSEDEWYVMKQHTLRGVEILKPLTELEECLKGIKYHHERYDGQGYPEGLKGDNIPLIAAIIAVADTLDAMTTDRQYRKAIPKETAIAEIKKNSEIQFHPLVVRALVELVEMGRI